MKEEKVETKKTKEKDEAPGWLTKWGEDMMTHGTATGYLSDKLLDTALCVGGTVLALVVYDKYIKSADVQDAD